MRRRDGIRYSRFENAPRGMKHPLRVLQKRGRLAKLDLSPIRSHAFEPQTRGTNLSDIRWVLRGQVLSHSSLTAESSGMSPENIVG